MYKISGSWGLHHGQGMRNKGKGTRNEEWGTHNKEQGTKILGGLDTDKSDPWMGPTLKFFQTVSVCTEIWHG